MSGDWLGRMARVYTGRAPAEAPAPPAPPPADDGPIAAADLARAEERALRSEKARLQAEIERHKEAQALASAQQTAARSQEALAREQTRQAHLAQVGGRSDGGAGRNDQTPRAPIRVSDILRAAARPGNLDGRGRDE